MMNGAIEDRSVIAPEYRNSQRYGICNTLAKEEEREMRQIGNGNRLDNANREIIVNRLTFFRPSKRPVARLCGPD